MTCKELQNAGLVVHKYKHMGMFCTMPPLKPLELQQFGAVNGAC